MYIRFSSPVYVYGLGYRGGDSFLRRALSVHGAVLGSVPRRGQPTARCALSIRMCSRYINMYIYLYMRCV